MNLHPRLLRPHPGASLIAAAALLLMAGACSSTTSGSAAATSRGLKWSGGAQPSSLGTYSRVLVEDFKERVTDRYTRTPLDQRAAKQDEMRRAVREVPDQLAEALRRTGAFTETLRNGTRDSRTLVVRGDVWRYDEGDSDVRRGSRHRFGNAQFEVHLELRDGSSSNVLATVMGQNAPAGSSGALQSAESLASSITRVLDDLAQTLASARKG